jgi:hypothetical protein
MAEMRVRAAKFAVDWRDVSSERAEAQTFWNEFMEVFGVSRRRRGVIFERPARRADTGRRGFIDVFWPRMMLAEHKSSGKIVAPTDGGQSNAEEQAWAYLQGGDIADDELPRYVVTSDFQTIQLTDLEIPAGEPGRTITFDTTDIADHVEAFAWLAGYESKSFWEKAQEEASISAATLMAALYVAASGDADTDPTISPDEEDAITHEASILMTRLLFLLFGDDAGLWEAGLFARFIRSRTSPDGSDLGSQLQAIFDHVNTPENHRSPRVDEVLRGFPYVNGGLFDNRRPVQYFDKPMRDALLKACDFDWTRISPAVFGSLFQSIKSREARRAEGEHYTSEENILKTLGPLFLDELRSAIEFARGKYDERARLRKLWASFKNYGYLDPACGCGNFLVVAYREMRQLELEIIIRLRELDATSGALDQHAFDELVTEGLLVSLDQFHGIELNWWPAKIAEVAMYLVDHQANRRMAAALGRAPNRLPINISAHIHHGNALTRNWSQQIPVSDGETVWVFGNPPYAGHEGRSGTQTDELRRAWSPRDIGRLDYVTAWHVHADAYLRDKQGEFAFVTTNSIVQGDQAPRLFSYLFEKGWRIKFAHRTFKWSTEVRAKDRAAVYVVIVGFSRTAGGSELYEYATPQAKAPQLLTVTEINEYLVEGPPLLISARRSPLSPGLPQAVFGNMPRDGGHLLIEQDQYEEVMRDAVAAKYVHRFVGGDQMLNNKPRWCLWLTDLDPADVPRSPVLTQRLKAVRDFRSKPPDKPGKRRASSTMKMAETPQLFGQRSQPDVPFVVIPRHVSEDRRYFTVALYDADVICGDSAFHADDPDGLLFALISSSMFITWQRTVGGALEGRLRFASTLSWNNFPMLELDQITRARIIKAGQRVLDTRAKHPDRTLVEHYNPLAMDPALIKAHEDLDRAVDRAFGARACAGPSVNDKSSCLRDTGNWQLTC